MVIVEDSMRVVVSRVTYVEVINVLGTILVSIDLKLAECW